MRVIGLGNLAWGVIATQQAWDMLQKNKSKYWSNPLSILSTLTLWHRYSWNLPDIPGRANQVYLAPVHYIHFFLFLQVSSFRSRQIHNVCRKSVTSWIMHIIIPPATKFRGGILDSPCSSVRLSVRLSVRPSVRPSVGRCPDDNSNFFQWI